MATLGANVSSGQKWFPLADAENVQAGLYTIDSENVEIVGLHLDSTRTDARVDGRWVKRGIAGSAKASHSSGATLTRYYPDAPGGGGGGSLTVDNTVDAPAAVTTLTTPGTVISGSEATLAYQIVKRTLDNDEIKALPATKVTLVPSPGAGKGLFVIGGAFDFALTAVYGNLGYDVGGVTYLYSEGTLFSPIPSFVLSGLSTEPAGGIRGRISPITNPIATISDRDVTQNAQSEGDYQSRGAFTLDQGLVIGIDNYDADFENDLGAFTGGDPANTLTITILYVVFDIAA